MTVADTPQDAETAAREALKPFAAFADQNRKVPADMTITAGSRIARRQLTMGDCYAAADALALRPASSPGEVTWQPIETAPRDGTEIIAWPCHFASGPAPVKAHWYVHPSVQGWITDELDCNDYDFSPTHWVPAPPALLSTTQTEAGNGR